MVFIHNTAEVSSKAKIGANSKVWNHVQIREDSEIGDNCIIGKGVYVDKGVKIGNNVKIGNSASLFYGLIVEDGVQISPHVCFTNDKLPRAINHDGTLKSEKDWVLSRTLVRYGASIGSKSVILPVTIGKWALVGAGSVVTKDVPDYGLVVGNPAKLMGYVCKCGKRLTEICSVCGISLEKIKK
ncbi:MAG: DapH/DapD/GlmU-related protein [Nanoarchaeota archaeon]